jgi:hypothetical protein
MKQGKPHKAVSEPLDLETFFGQEYLGELYERVSRPVLLASQFGIHLRVLNGWMNKMDEQKKRLRQRYSFIDFTFFKIVEQLRELEVSLPMIKKLKANILAPQKITNVFSKFEHTGNILQNSNLSGEEKARLMRLLFYQEEQKEIDQENFTWLHLFVMLWIFHRGAVSIVIFKDGSCLLENEESIMKIGNRNYISISISEIMREFLLSDQSNKVLSELAFLSHAENKIFEVLENGNYQRITVFYLGNSSTSTLEKDKTNKEKIVEKMTQRPLSKFEIRNKKGETIVLDNKSITL